MHRERGIAVDINEVVRRVGRERCVEGRLRVPAARRGPSTSLSTFPAASGANSTTVTGRRLRPRLITPSPAVRRFRTQLELSWRCVEIRKLRPLPSNKSTGVVRGCPDLRPRTVSNTIGPMGSPRRSSPLRTHVAAAWGRVDLDMVLMSKMIRPADVVARNSGIDTNRSSHGAAVYCPDGGDQGGPPEGGRE